MALTPAVISKGPGTSVIRHEINIDFYDSLALTHSLYRSTSPMGGDPVANGVKIKNHINPEELLVDTDILVGNTYYYALVSSTELDAETKFKSDLDTLGYSHIYENSKLILLPNHIGHTVDNDSGTYKEVSMIESVDPLRRTSESIYRIGDGFFRHHPGDGTGGSFFFPILPWNATGQGYFRFWLYFDYDTDWTGPNTTTTRVLRDSDWDFILELDNNRPRPKIDFSDGAYNSRRSSNFVASRWDLHEVMWDYNTSTFRWLKQPGGLFNDQVVRSTTRAAGATTYINGNIQWYSYTVTNQPLNFGSIFYSQTIPTDLERENWFNQEKIDYGY